jgi:hypothetical protein
MGTSSSRATERLFISCADESGRGVVGHPRPRISRGGYGARKSASSSAGLLPTRGKRGREIWRPGPTRHEHRQPPETVVTAPRVIDVGSSEWNKEAGRGVTDLRVPSSVTRRRHRCARDLQSWPTCRRHLQELGRAAWSRDGPNSGSLAHPGIVFFFLFIFFYFFFLPSFTNSNLNTNLNSNLWPVHSQTIFVQLKVLGLRIFIQIYYSCFHIPSLF